MAVNLAELTGKESAVTGAYRELMGELGRPDAAYAIRVSIMKDSANYQPHQVP